MAPETDSSDRPGKAGAMSPGLGGIAGFEAEALPHMDALFRAAASILHSRSEAEDAVQETYLQALKSFQRFTAGTNCRAWLFRILFHVISHHRRKWFAALSSANERNWSRQPFTWNRSRNSSPTMN